MSSIVYLKHSWYLKAIQKQLLPFKLDTCWHSLEKFNKNFYLGTTSILDCLRVQCFILCKQQCPSKLVLTGLVQVISVKDLIVVCTVEWNKKISLPSVVYKYSFSLSFILSFSFFDLKLCSRNYFYMLCYLTL